MTSRLGSATAEALKSTGELEERAGLVRALKVEAGNPGKYVFCQREIALGEGPAELRRFLVVRRSFHDRLPDFGIRKLEAKAAKRRSAGFSRIDGEYLQPGARKLGPSNPGRRSSSLAP